jgi:hypothetical protein
MSTDDVARFIRCVAERPALNKKLAARPREVDAWLECAHEAGFAFTREQLLGFCALVAGHELPSEQAIHVLLASADGAAHGLVQVGFGIAMAAPAVPPVRFAPGVLARL